ncbi:thioredoxin family protein [Actinomadura madurae]|uniref:thioredoxin family protein n=1 Tax=Actinomadura madurae TaxID=1993 RepID=UPI002025F20C|nr:thioredoxin domain-containing protein [Actinomadura madurae]MCP9952706.1 thioredoxin family protein [Actinomadura madurae]MCP9969471.1 thioredoxin family protein [Actinomadura madurae]MCP9981926.1 thioredoxin family protein [Actinomadura madurae]MCQ0006547.1 thioredoxin family protein [Actinomadura madurae]MCQ0018158.1 thioredoxin family protein [Actinomadura madurae]
MNTTTLTALTEADFDAELARTAEPLMVDFWAESCLPCQALAPVLEQIAAEHAGRLRIATVRLDDNPGLARRFQIMALPTLIVFIDGRETKRITEVTTKAGLHRELGAVTAGPHGEDRQATTAP